MYSSIDPTKVIRLVAAHTSSTKSNQYPTEKEFWSIILFSLNGKTEQRKSVCVHVVAVNWLDVLGV